MKTNDPLDDLLLSWNPPPGVPASFREQVWHRLAASSDDTASTSVRPFRARVVAMAASAVIVAGFGLGLLSGSGSVSRDRSAYFTRIDPIAQTR